MQDRSQSPVPLPNLILFFVLSLGLLIGYPMLMARLNPRPPADQAAKQEGAAKQADGAKPAEKPAAEKPAAEKPVAEKPAGAKPKDAPAQTSEQEPAAKTAAEPEKPVDPKWVTLGSADPADPYRMLVTLSNQGAALARIELTSPDYRDLEDRTGYLGHLVLDDSGAKKGYTVQVVGAGTPAAKAGLKPGDRITAIDGSKADGYLALEQYLARTKPGDTVELTVARGGETLTLPATLTRRPLEVVRPETRMPHVFETDRRDLIEKREFDAVDPVANAPLSLLTTLEQLDGRKIEAIDDPKAVERILDQEIDGLNLRTANWHFDEKQSNQDRAVFHYIVRSAEKKELLRVTKTYWLEKVAQDEQGNPDARAYDLKLKLEVRNIDPSKADHEVAYRLDGPNGLPKEGGWYAVKVSHAMWSGAGLRDVVYRSNGGETTQVTCPHLSTAGSEPLGAAGTPIDFLAVDAQYFAAAMIPGEEVRQSIQYAIAMRVGDVDPQRNTATNTSFRVISKAETLKAGGAPLSHEYTLFAGPKKPSLLAQYELGSLVYYGWFGWVAEPMTRILHAFYGVVGNFGLAIIMLTVLVRLCMFPLSKKQTLNAQKMQALQPEIKRIQEKYKRDLEAKGKAMQELQRKHNFNPLGGCLLVFVQLPIFLGLYRSLQVDVALRDAPLISEAIRWCSNLAGPDMLFDWSRFMPDMVVSGLGMLGLGPYFNILPLLTIGLFIIQQKVMMPPPADEQAAMQQKMMNFMMIFMGILFYKVAAGLCIYFIASTLWGLGERRFLPKMAKAQADATQDGPARLSRSAEAARDAIAKKKKRRGAK